MLRIAVLALLVAATPAFGQTAFDDLKDESRRIDQRTLPAYDRAMSDRDVFASIHVTLGHGAYKAVKAARANYDKVKASVDKAMAARDYNGAAKLIGEQKDAAVVVVERLEEYTASSSDAVLKIQIGLGVLAFVIAGLAVWILKRRR